MTGINIKQKYQQKDKKVFKEYILSLLSFENEEDWKVNTRHYLPKVEIKDYSVMIDGKNFFDQPVKSHMRNMTIFAKLQQIKEMIIQLVVC